MRRTNPNSPPRAQNERRPVVPPSPDACVVAPPATTRQNLPKPATPHYAGAKRTQNMQPGATPCNQMQPNRKKAKRSQVPSWHTPSPPSECVKFPNEPTAPCHTSVPSVCSVVSPPPESRNPAQHRATKPHISPRGRKTNPRSPRSSSRPFATFAPSRPPSPCACCLLRCG
jgi:hypothetical protein